MATVSLKVKAIWRKPRAYRGVLIGTLMRDHLETSAAAGMGSEIDAAGQIRFFNCWLYSAGACLR